MRFHRSLARAVTVAVALCAVSASAEELAIGAQAPEFKLKNVDGKDYTLAQVASGKDGKPAAATVVVFTCNHCPFAKDWEQRIVELANGYTARGIGAVLINANNPDMHPEDGYAEMQTRAKSRGMKIPYVVDDTSAVARAFGASVTPEAFLFDKSGKLVYHGAIDDNRKQPDKVQARYLKDALDAVLAGKAPPVAETKSLGCGIKFRS